MVSLPFLMLPEGEVAVQFKCRVLLVPLNPVSLNVALGRTWPKKLLYQF
jgi:hypothetical protein